MENAPVTSEFRQEFESETGQLLGRRFIWFIVSVGVVYIMARVAALASFATIMVMSAANIAGVSSMQKAVDAVRLGRVGMWLVLLFTFLDLGLIIWSGIHIHKAGRRKIDLLKFTQNIFMFLGFSQICVAVLLDATGFPWQLCVYHMLACAFLPWTPMQALRPMLPVLLLNAGAELVFGTSEPAMKAFLIIASLLMMAPGIFIAWVKHSRRVEGFRVRMLQTRYGQMRRELFDAQRIHEALFPEPIPTGPLRFAYRYRPMLQIGGDYLYARFSPPVSGGAPAFNLLLLDVTGHGIAAALTVNRLYGEVERLFAEDPHASPGAVLSALNRYVHLTLATHSVYVTALCIRVDQDLHTLEYASGGHPPAFICAANGTIDQLDSTSFVLGAAAAADFDPAVQSRPFVAGDTLLAYTDGALECRNQQGRMLGVKGLTKFLASVHTSEQAGRSGLASVVLAAVESHRHGPTEDDTLVVEITRALEVSGPQAGAAIDATRQRTTISA